MERKPRRGRPPTGRARTVALSLRTTEEIRNALVEAAETSGRNLTQETEHIIKSYFAHEAEVETAFGDIPTYRLMLLFANVAQMVQLGANKPWYEDKATAQQTANIWLGLLEQFKAESRGPVVSATATSFGDVKGALDPALKKSLQPIFDEHRPPESIKPPPTKSSAVVLRAVPPEAKKRPSTKQQSRKSRSPEREA